MNKNLAAFFIVLLCFSFTFHVKAADVLINTSQTFSALDASDGTTDGVFTVTGNLTIAAGGIINCNDPSGSGNGACPIRISVSGNIEILAGGIIYAENRIADGNGGNITITVGGTFIMRSPATPNAGALISSSNLTATSGNKDAGAITIQATGNLNIEAGSTIKANAYKGKGGDINLTGNNVAIDGNVLSQSGASGTGAVQGPGGGMIIITTSHNLLVNNNGVLSSKGGDSGADLVHLCGCNVTIYGLVESTGSGHAVPNNPVNHLSNSYRPDKPSNSTAGIEIWAANSLVIDNLNHNGQVKADLCCSGGTNGTSWIDLFSKGSINIIGKTVAYNNSIQGSNFAVHANGTAGNTDNGGTITVRSKNATVTASGLAVQADGTEFGGLVEIEAFNIVTTNTAKLFARGDVGYNGGNGKGGNINIRSFQQTISWQNGLGDVRPTGGTIPVKGLITLKKCTDAVNVSGTAFPDNGAPATSPQMLGDECAGSPAFASYVSFCDCPPEEGPCVTPTVDAGPDQNVCNVTSVTLAGNNPSPNTGTWTKVSGTGGTITDPSLYNTTVTGLSAGTYVFRWTIGEGITCTASNDVQIRIYEQPSADAGPDQALCNETSVTLAGNNPSVGTGTWIKISGTGGTITNPALYNTTVTGLSAGTYVYRWTVVNGECSANNDVQIIIYAQPTANAGPDQGLCNVTSATLAGNNPSPGTGTWTKVSGTGGTITSPSLYNTTVTGLSVGTYVYRWTVVNGECSANNDVQITIYSQPTADAGPDQQWCNTLSVTLAGNNPSAGTGTWTKVSGTGGTITNPSLYNTTVTGLSVDTYVFRWTVVNGACSASNDVQIINQSCACLGGHTPGFWSNKNGQALLTGGNLCTLNSLCLRKANGADFDMVLTCPSPTNQQVNKGKNDFKTWLLSGEATNMAYMLSVHLSAMHLNVAHGFVSPAALVYAPGAGNTGAGNNYITIGDLLVAADAALCSDGFTPSGDANRNAQENIKNALDNANNNRNFVDINCTTSSRIAGVVSIAQPSQVSIAKQLRLAILASPNPSNSRFTIVIESDNAKDPVTLRIVDLYGRVVEKFEGLHAGQTLQVGSKFIPGMYMAEIRQGNNYRQIKLNKQ